MINFDVDTSQASAAIGYLSGIAKSIASQRFMDGVTDLTYAKLSEEFGRQMDLVAKSNPDNYHHVYEWRLTGIKKGRLWRTKVRGRGSKKIATFEFKASRTPVPSPMERYRSRRDDPIKKVPFDVVKRLSNRKHFFYWKAPIMESAAEVTIRPKYSSVLFVPVDETIRSSPRDQNRGYVFTRHAIQTNPGGEKTTGRFTGFWTAWWSGPAQDVFDVDLKKYFESDITKTNIKQVLARYSVARRGRAASLTRSQRAYRAGQETAQAFFKLKAGSYKRRAEMLKEENDG